MAQGNFYGRMVMSYVMPWDVSPSKQQRDVKVGCSYKTYSNPYMVTSIAGKVFVNPTACSMDAVSLGARRFLRFRGDSSDSGGPVEDKIANMQILVT